MSTHEYVVIGIDGRTYGPASFDQICKWVEEHRVDGNTMARLVDENEFRPLRDFEEFREVLSRVYGPGMCARHEFQRTDVALSEPELLGERNQSSKTRAESWSIASIFADVLQLVKRQLSFLVLASAIVWSIQMAILMLGALGVLARWLIAGPLLGGLFLATLVALRTGRSELGMIFAPFRSGPVPLILAYLLKDMLVMLGSLVFIIPGLIIWMAFWFVIPIVAEKRVPVLLAMQLSAGSVFRWFWKFGIVLGITYLPLTLFGVWQFLEVMQVMSGLFAKGPTSYEELLRAVQPVLARTELLRLVVWLINLPLIVAVQAVMYQRVFAGSAGHDPRPEAR